MTKGTLPLGRDLSSSEAGRNGIIIPFCVCKGDFGDEWDGEEMRRVKSNDPKSRKQTGRPV
jgi:hypothetical protein